MSEWNSGSQRFERFWAADVMGTAVDDVVREWQTIQKRLAYMVWVDGYVTGYGALISDGTSPDPREGLSCLMRAIAEMPIPAKDPHPSIATDLEFVDRQTTWYRETFLPVMQRLQALVPAELTERGSEKHVDV